MDFFRAAPAANRSIAMLLAMAVALASRQAIAADPPLTLAEAQSRAVERSRQLRDPVMVEGVKDPRVHPGPVVHWHGQSLPRAASYRHDTVRLRQGPTRVTLGGPLQCARPDDRLDRQCGR